MATALPRDVSPAETTTGGAAPPSDSDVSDDPPIPEGAGGWRDDEDDDGLHIIRDDDPSTAAVPVDLDWLGAHLQTALIHLDRPVTRLGVRIVSDATMTALHEQHCRIAATTDVLTFPETEGSDRSIRADIAVCIDEAARQAATHGYRVERELLLYIIHGLLHCAGFDDREPDEYALMHAEEDRILRAIGVGSTFAPGAPDP